MPHSAPATTDTETPPDTLCCVVQTPAAPSVHHDVFNAQHYVDQARRYCHVRTCGSWQHVWIEDACGQIVLCKGCRQGSVSFMLVDVFAHGTLAF